MNKIKMTIKEIREQLNSTDVSTAWLRRLEGDPRQGVQQLLQQWHRRQERKRQLKKQWETMSHFERFYKAQGLMPIAGVDEAGRGPLAGPVVAAAVILPDDCYIPGLNDSKKLQATEREHLYAEIDRLAIAWKTAVVPVERIDEINIYNASLEAMTLAVKLLDRLPKVLLNDAVILPEIDAVQEKIVDGDRRSVSIAAASVMAKVTRDHLMKELGARYPEYGFERHMGYATAEHLQALREYGPTKAHRRSFAPVREIGGPPLSLRIQG